MPELPGGTVTLLFTDMEGSTRLLQQLGKQYTDVLAECRKLLRAAFQVYSGHEVDTQGDSFFVTFARATDAVLAAVAIQRNLIHHSWPEGVVVRVRIGLHTGEPQLVSGDYIGIDVHHAARIMSAGHGGQILLSQTTSSLVEQNLPEGVLMQDLGEHRLKDLHHPTHLFQLNISGLPTEFPLSKHWIPTPTTYLYSLPLLLDMRSIWSVFVNYYAVRMYVC
ncbi:MAG: adenylate/guanylate cyclase domain-containing protein [Chloroflexota bacterium]|nr:adenylate/guanylate cyclase domain-containing protein [Chloroflexota bacterium]